MATTCIDNILCENAWSCNITVLDVDGNPINPLDLNNGDSVVFALGEKPGYNFEGWVLDDNTPIPYTPLGDNRYLINYIDCSRQYLAKYCAITYTVHVNCSNSCFNNYEIQPVYYGQTVTVSAQDGLSCRFLYWTKDGDVYSEAHSFEYVVTEDATFVAQYDNIQYLIVAKPSKPNMGTCTGGGFYEYNDTVTLSANASNGYLFDGWSDGITDNPRVIIVKGNKTYIANFLRGSNNVNVLPVEGGIVMGAGNYGTGSVVSLQPIPDAGWVFSHWLVNGVTYYRGTYDFIIDSDKVVTPVFTKASYTVNFSTIPYGAAVFTPSVGGSYEYGSTIMVEAVPNSNYIFKGWKDGFAFPKREITVLCNAEYVAVFERKPVSYRIRVYYNGVTSCSIYASYVDIALDYTTFAQVSVQSGTKLTLSPVIPEGERLVSVIDGDNNTVWSASDNGNPLAIPYTVGEEDVDLTLNLETMSFRVSVSASPLDNDTSGTIRVTTTIGNTYNFFNPTIYNPKAFYDGIAYGTNIQLGAPLTVGDYTFSYWCTGAGSFTTTTITIPVTQSMDCVAVFKK